MLLSSAMVGGNTPQSTTARLVDRFRKAPARPRRERESNDEFLRENGHLEGKFWWKECRRGNCGNVNNMGEKKAILTRINNESAVVVNQPEKGDKKNDEKIKFQGAKTLCVEGDSEKSDDGDNKDNSDTSRGEMKMGNEEEKDISNNIQTTSLKSSGDYVSGMHIGDGEKEGTLQRMNTVEHRMIAIRTSPPLNEKFEHLHVCDSSRPQSNCLCVNSTNCSSSLVRGTATHGCSDVADNIKNKIRGLNINGSNDQVHHSTLETMDTHVNDMIEGLKRYECDVKVVEKDEESPSDIIEQLRIELGLDRMLLPYLNTSTEDNCPLKRHPRPSFHNNGNSLLTMAEDLIQDSIRKIGESNDHLLQQPERPSPSGDVVLLSPIQKTLFDSEDGLGSHSNPEMWDLEADDETRLLSCHEFDNDPVVATLRKRMNQLQMQLNLKDVS